MRDLIGRMGRAFVVALAAPVAVRDAVRGLTEADAERRMLSLLHEHTLGQRDELRDQLRTANGHRIVNANTAATLADRVTELHDELKIARGERDGYRSDVQDLTDRLAVANRSCVELKNELDRARTDRDAVEVARRETIDLLSDREGMLKDARGEVVRLRDLLHAAERANERLTQALGNARTELATLRKPAESSAPTMLDEACAAESALVNTIMARDS